MNMDYQDIPTPLQNTNFYSMFLVSLTLQQYTPQTKQTFSCNYDYIIVGGGTAGSVLAARLSEDPSVRVLLLEAGSSPPPITEVPAILTHLLGSYIDWNILSVPQPQLNNRQLPLHIGKGIGGTSLLSYMYHNRGNPKDFNNWAAAGAKGWSYEEVLPYFIKSEDFRVPELYDPAYHGIGGPISVEKTTVTSITQEAVHKAIKRTGKSAIDGSAFSIPGYSYSYADNRDGKRCSTGKAYLVPAGQRPNLDIVANALVTKILIENQGAVGVRVEFNGLTFDVHTWREVILTAGAIFTPQLLMLSGIGPRKELETFQIPVLANLPVGYNYQDLPLIFYPYSISSEIPSLDRQLQDPALADKFIHCGIGSYTSMGGCHLIIFSTVQENATQFEVPNLETYINDGGPHEGLPGAETILSCIPMVLKPEGRGRVKLQSADPHVIPLVDPNDLSNEHDLEVMIKGLKNCNEFMASPELVKIGAKRYPVYDDDCGDINEVNENDFLTCEIRNGAQTAWHYGGSTKMGDPSDPSTVLDSKLRVKGIANLRVADASVIPEIPAGNLHATVVMIAEKAADLIKYPLKCP